MDFGYVRVSTKDQNPARQIKILMDMGIEERNIYVEKKYGHNFEREGYDMLVNHIMRPGDRLTVTELKRFGRNYREIYREWHHITKELGMDIRVADNKILDTSLNKELLGQVITDVVLALLSYVAEGDYEERHELQRQGIETAKEARKYLGRPRVEYPENWSECYGAWKEGSITAVEAMRRTGLKKDSFYRLVKNMRTGNKFFQESSMGGYLYLLNNFQGGDEMKQGTLFYDRKSDRYNFHYTDEDGDKRDYGGIHCGEVFEFKLNDIWVPARVEMGMDNQWYLVGLPGLRLDGLEVRQE